MQFAEPVVVSEPNVAQPRCIFISSLIAHASAEGSDLLIVRDNHAPFRRGHLLVGVEGKNSRITKGSDAPPTILGSERFASILDDVQSILPRELHDGINIARKPKNVDWEDGPDHSSRGFVEENAAACIETAALPQKTA